MFWSGAGGRCRAAVVLAPDRAVEAGTLLDLGLLALFDALAVLAPPQMPLVIRRPGDVEVNGGTAATVDATQGSGWAVLGFEVLLQTDEARPGDRPDRTCLAEEGFGDVGAGELLAHVCRHLLGWVDAWLDGGAGPLSRAVDQREARQREALHREARRAAA